MFASIDSPRISVVMPVYNAEETLNEAILSVLDQSYPDFELLIIDDGSTDSSCEIVESFTDSRIKFYSRENRGLGSTLNELLSLASGSYICRMDSDDVCMPLRLAEQVDFLESHPNVSMVGGQIIYFTGDGSMTLSSRFPLLHHEILKGLVNQSFYICHPSVMFRSEVARIFGGYRISGLGEDLDFFLRMSEYGEIRNIKSNVLKYRLTMSSASISNPEELDMCYSYSIYNYHRRLAGKDEVSVDSFLNNIYLRRSIFLRFSKSLEYFSKRLYRKALILRLRGSLIKYLFFISSASICSPLRALKKVQDGTAKFIFTWR